MDKLHWTVILRGIVFDPKKRLNKIWWINFHPGMIPIMFDPKKG
jgi:hypothetical protein